jgi:type II secretory pathway pseudopilin PulG
MNLSQPKTGRAFSLGEVVIAIGIASFAGLATLGLLSVANDTGKNARDEQSAARLAANEFARLRSLGSANFATTYLTRFFDSRLVDLGTDRTTALNNGAMYELRIPNDPGNPASGAFAPAPAGTGDWLLNAEVWFPVAAPSDQNRTVYRFTAIVNNP